MHCGQEIFLKSEIRLGTSKKSAEYLTHIVDCLSLTCDQRRDVTRKKTAHCVSWEPKRKPTEVEHRSLDKRKSLVHAVNPWTNVSQEEHTVKMRWITQPKSVDHCTDVTQVRLG